MEDCTVSIRDLLSDAGASLAGIADLSPEGLSPIPDLGTAVVWGLALDPTIVRTLATGPSVAYSREYTAVNARLAAQEERVVAYLEKMGCRAVGISPTTGDFDTTTLSAEFPHKTAATRAGLGWVGKCALLVTRDYGSAIRFTSVLTDAPLTPDAPVERSYCGTCEECRTACPVAAPSGRQWEPGIERDAFWDSRACYMYCRKMADERGLDLVCGMCIVACPWTRKYLKRSE
ncbi:epoxyqueuosine reductase [Methanofollis ethanolicus]|uniref:epoxyqueuosine reductase n=1 Tax=Methanofollis ethanolicus TaxID=488124 RepID=UPI00082D914F|nr:epoxyqueuosine reductase [Methanofollis ethanolicus]